MASRKAKDQTVASLDLAANNDSVLGEVKDLAQKLLVACEGIDDADLRKQAELDIVGIFQSRRQSYLIPVPEGTFYEIQDNIQALLDTIDGLDEGSEERKSAEADLALWFESEVRKVDAIAAYIDFTKAQAELAKKGAERYSKQAETWKNREQRTRDMVKRIMIQFGLPSLPGRMATFSLRPSQGSLVITDEALIPSEFIQYSQSIKRDEVKAAIKAGRDVDGADISMGDMTLYIT